MSAGLTLAQLNDLRTSLLPRVNKGFRDSQKLVRFNGQRLFLKNAKTVSLPQDAKISWKFRYKPAPGPISNAPYKATSATYDEFMSEAGLYLNQHVDKNFVYDTTELRANKGNPDKIFDILKARRSAQREGIAIWLEAQLLTAIPTNSTDRDTYNSLRTILRRSMTSGGVYVPLPDGGFNGVYNTWGDGTTSDAYAGLTLSSANNERMRSYCITHDGVVNQSFCDRIKKAQDDNAWEPLEDLQGQFDTSDMFVIMMDPAFSQDYENFVSQGPDFRKGDVYPFRSYTINGAKKMSVPQLTQDAARPVYGVNTMEVVLNQVENCWDNFAEMSSDGKKLAADPKPFENSHTSFYEPIDFFGNLICEMPRNAGFCMHGAF